MSNATANGTTLIDAMANGAILWVIVTLASLAGLAVVARAGLTGWNGWLALCHARIAHHHAATPPTPAARIEIADLRERVRRLEAIAAGIDL